jgi:hypothetical protein
MQNEEELLNHVLQMDFEIDSRIYSIIKCISDSDKNWTLCTPDGYYMRKREYVNGGVIGMYPKEIIPYKESASAEDLATDNYIYMLTFDEALGVITKLLNSHKIN